MNKKEIIIGFIVGVLANITGVLVTSLLLSKGKSVSTVLSNALTQDFLGKLISLGAILNLVVFFVFIKRKQDYRARGVLIATLLIAVITIVIKFL